MSWWSSSPAVEPSECIHPVTATKEAQTAPFAELTRKDLEWTFAPGMATETHTFYVASDDGVFAFVQIIHNSLGGWSNTVQLTCRVYDPKQDKPFSFWKSLNLSGFATTTDKADVTSNDGKLSFTLSPDSESYEIKYSADPEMQLIIPSLKFHRIGKGWMCAPDGKTHFGATKADGFVLHKFWPRCHVEGTLMVKGQPIELNGAGLFVHAIQGLRPNLVATQWNYANFQAQGQDTALALMDYTTQPGYGSKLVSVGSVTLNGELVSVTIDNMSKHTKTTKDAETSYDAPEEIEYTWTGKTITGDKDVHAKLVISNLGTQRDQGGLIEKVDVLGEVPILIKKFVNVVAQTKPYIYQVSSVLFTCRLMTI